mgnify:FL=1
MLTIDKTFSGIQKVPKALSFNENSLLDWMKLNIEEFEGPIIINQFRGGQSNPTYKIESKSHTYVLRRKPPGKLLPSAHAVDREFKIMSALHSFGYPVPRMYSYCEDQSVIGTSFYIMDYVEGRIFWDPLMPEIPSKERYSLYEAANKELAKLHNINFKQIKLENYGKPGNYFSRQISRWSSQYRSSETTKIKEMDNLISWLPSSIPDQERTSIVHGDFRIDNIIFHPTEPRVLAVLDWELSTLGDPLSDFTYHLMQWKMPPEVRGGFDSLKLREYGIPELEEYINLYCKRTNRNQIINLDFYFSFNVFRLAAIIQGVYSRALNGNASNRKAIEMGEMVYPLAKLSWEFAIKAGA